MVKKIKDFLFYNTTARQTVAKNSLWLSVSNFGGRIVRSILVIYAARILGPTEWGIFNYAITIAAFLTLFVDAGVNQTMMRENAKTTDPKHKIGILSTSFFLKCVLLTAGIFIVLFIAPRIPTAEAVMAEKAAALFPFIALILAFDTLRQFGFSVIDSEEKMQWEAGLFLLTNLSIVGAGFFALTHVGTVVSFTVAYAAGTGIGMIATFLVLRHYFKGLLTNFTRSLVKPIFFSAWPFAISGLLGMLMINTDVVMIGWLLSAENVGLYSAPQRIIQLLYLIPSIISISILPVFARLARNDDKKMAHMLEYLISATFLLAFPLAAGGLLLGQNIISFIFGGGFAAATLSFRILLLTLLIDFPAIILSNAIFSYNKQKKLIVYSALGGFSNVFLNILLIPVFGIAGCALATLIAQCISNIYLWHTMKALNPIAIFPRLKNIAIATAVMAVTTFGISLLSIHILLNIIISACAYFAVLYFLREPVLREIKVMLRQTVSTEQAVYESASG